jgi:hypothetical protein
MMPCTRFGRHLLRRAPKRLCPDTDRCKVRLDGLGDAAEWLSGDMIQSDGEAIGEAGLRHELLRPGNIPPEGIRLDRTGNAARKKALANTPETGRKVLGDCVVVDRPLHGLSGRVNCGSASFIATYIENAWAADAMP